MITICIRHYILNRKVFRSTLEFDATFAFLNLSVMYHAKFILFEKINVVDQVIISLVINPLRLSLRSVFRFSSQSLQTFLKQVITKNLINILI